MRAYIPNFITCLNLLSGCLACLMAFEGNFLWALWFIILSAVFDFFDGFAARILKAYSAMGKELDSLADLISFGMAPGLIVFKYLSISEIGITSEIASYLPYLGFFIPIFSALRLAKFNIDDRQTSSFIGLPVPANALFWASLIPALIQLSDKYTFLPFICIALVFIFSWLLVSNIPMFSLKISKCTWKGNEIAIVFVCMCILILSISNIYWGISLCICTYILISLLSNLICKKTK